MPNTVRIEELIQKALDQFGSELEVLELLPPCTKLEVKLTLVRGSTSVVAETQYHLRHQRGAHLQDDRPLTKEDWEAIIDLPEFARLPETAMDNRMLAMLREFKRRGKIEQLNVSFPVIPRLNEVLKRNKTPYRVISFKPKGKGYHFKVTRII